MSAGIANFANSYARLPERFYARQPPTPVAKPRLVVFNRALADELGLRIASLDDADLAAIFSGNRIPEGAEPLSMAYAGHQFGHFVPQLGDGRAILLGEVIDRSGARRDIQLKGAGPTPYSRRGDGRAALGPVLREYLVSEAMNALGIPATRALAAVATGEAVFREAVLPGAVLTRVARSHVRVGTFQYFAVRGDVEALGRLAEQVIERHYPDARSAERPPLALLEAVVRAQARLIALWMGVGFIHGVMNTDNMAVSGETIDFGPCAFMEAYDPATVFSAIDEMGRYAYSNQPRIALWNLTRLAEALLPLFDADEGRAADLAREVLGSFPACYESEWQAVMRAKLGLISAQDGDRALIDDLLALMQAGEVDFTLAFRGLCELAVDAVDRKATMSAAPSGSPYTEAALRARFGDAAAFDAWVQRWRARAALEAPLPAERARMMRRVNPALIPRNHRVEQALTAASERGDFAPFHKLLQILSSPYEEREETAAYALPASAAERVNRTYCGT
jgi:uncharacterized protein YdiU (UPF0061 family)